MSKKKNKQGLNIISETKSEIIATPVVKEISYIVDTPIKCDNVRYSIGDIYKGENIKHLLESKAIRVNK
jgi:hypothetical protein